MERMSLLSPDGGGTGAFGTPQGETNQDDRLAAAEAQASAAVARYRELVAASPGLVAEMVRGSTIEEIDATAEAARQAYTTISRQITQQHEQAVSPGNPARSSSTAGAESLKPEAKIALGLRGR
jgi:hypothetical protein